jgi:hypothetical protein
MQIIIAENKKIKVKIPNMANARQLKEDPSLRIIGHLPEYGEVFKDSQLKI